MDIYVYDFESGTNQLVSRNFSAGYAPNRPSDLPAISPDGRLWPIEVSRPTWFQSLTNGTRQTYLYDRQTGITTVIGPSAFSGGAANSRAQAMVFSGNSQNLVFRSSAADLLTLDFNQSEDIFSWNWLLPIQRSRSSARWFTLRPPVKAPH